MVVPVEPGEALELEADIAPGSSALPATAVTATIQAERVQAFRAALASEPAFRGFYGQVLPRVYGYLVSRCRGDTSLAEDLTQATFTEVVRERARFDGRSDVVTWLIGIARHKLVDHFRAQEREERSRLHLVVHELAMDREVGVWRDIDEREVLIANLGKLTAMQRAVLILHYADGLPVREVAHELGRSESATESLLTRAREALRHAYGEPTDA